MDELSGGSVHAEIADTYPLAPPAKTTTLRLSEVKRLLGMDFRLAEVQRILTSLEFACTAHPDSPAPSLTVNVPSHRLDVSIPADLIEEIARIHGYEAIPLTLMQDVLPPQRSQPVREGLERTRDILVGCGLQEILSYAFTSLDSIQRAQVGQDTRMSRRYIRVANPISQEREFLRQSLLPSMLETLRTQQSLSPAYDAL